MLNLQKVRRGQVFSFTLTELILLILFILLLLLWLITDKKDKQIDKWIEVTGTKTPKIYKDLYPNFPDTTTAPDLQDQLIVANKKILELEEIINKFTEKTGKNNPEDLPNDPKSKIAKDEKGLGRNPPCWPKGWPTKPDYEKADRIFNILFLGTDQIAIIPSYKEVYIDQYKLLPINKNILSTDDDYRNDKLKIISSGQFIKNFKSLLEVSKKETHINDNNLTLKRDCRHEVNVFDMLNDNKTEYKRLLHGTVENIFTYYIFQDDTYFEYLEKYK